MPKKTSVSIPNGPQMLSQHYDDFVSRDQNVGFQSPPGLRCSPNLSGILYVISNTLVSIPTGPQMLSQPIRFIVPRHNRLSFNPHRASDALPTRTITRTR